MSRWRKEASITLVLFEGTLVGDDDYISVLRVYTGLDLRKVSERRRWRPTGREWEDQRRRPMMMVPGKESNGDLDLLRVASPKKMGWEESQGGVVNPTRRGCRIPRRDSLEIAKDQ
ncbi:hypothetical protein L6452_36191 [Arctium lappa]|uniref:Uncharacterized protein n=1 Tax=Arctium lappa TaxID=4217 RepID=A0ACB8Y970_ARCLA|nr:hypothetical protein L6452_36191 [Arctium lappa]